ncbi:hypothetical protein TSOC_003922, partial [Tetrabaena socialis]
AQVEAQGRGGGGGGSGARGAQIVKPQGERNAGAGGDELRRRQV